MRMSIAGAVAVVVVGVGLLGSTPARAEDAAEPKLAVGGSIALWIPQSDADDIADVSLGIRPQVTYWLTPMIGLTGAFDFVLVNEESGVDDVTYYAISAGARITMPGPRTIKPYGELLLGLHFIDTDGFSDNGIGFRFGGGATYAISPRLQASAGVAYSTASIDTGFDDVTIAAFIFDVGLAARF